MNAFTMISLVIFSGMLLFTGAFLQRFLSAIRLIISSAVITLCVISLIPTSDQWLMLSAQRTDFATVVSLMTHAPTVGHRIVALLVPFIVGGSSLFFVRRFPRISATSGVFLSVFLLTGLLLFTFISITVWLLIGIATASGLIALAIRHRWFEGYHIVTTAVFGGLLFAYAFTRFYYLPLWVGILLGTASIAVGLSSQLHTYRKQHTQQE